jgi:hypothetical protein
MRYPFSGPSAMALVLLLSYLASEVSAQDLRGLPAAEVAIAEESVQLRYMIPPPGTGAGELGFGFFLNENRDLVASSNFYVEASQLGFRDLTILLGPVAYAALLSTENNDIFSIALGAEARLQILRRPELTAVGRAAYAPDILTFGSADNLWDIVGRLELPLTDRVIGFGGYRLFEIDLLTGKSELEESIHLGIRYRF